MADDDEPKQPSAIEQIVTIAQGAGKDAVAGAVGAAALSGGDPAAIVGGALVGALRGGAKEGAAALARALWDSPADRALAGAVSVEAREHLRQVEPIVEENAEKLLEDPDVRREDLASNTAAILVSWERAYRATGDAKKRRVIMAALGNAFRPELFKEGLTLRLFRILEDLDYPEIQCLRTRFEPSGELAPRLRSQIAAATGSELSEHIERLLAHRLLCRCEPSEGDIVERVRKTVKRAWLGDRLLELCADTEALNRIWPDPDAKPDAPNGS